MFIDEMSVYKMFLDKMSITKCNGENVWKKMYR